MQLNVRKRKQAAARRDDGRSARSAGPRGGPVRPLALLVAAAILIATPSLSFAQQKDEGDQDNLPHQLKNVTMCVDNDSVALHLDELAADRQHGAAALLAPGASNALLASVRRLDPHAVSRRGSCAGSTTYLAIDIRIIPLDPAQYRHYAAPAFSYAVWVQVGGYVAPQMRSPTEPTLANLSFEGFDENVFSESGAGSGGNGGKVDPYVLDRVSRLLSDMVSAYRSDNR